jgi:hypothetical protein
MTEPSRPTAKCQDHGEDRGDVTIDLISDILGRMNLNPDDSLAIGSVNRAIVLRPIRHPDSRF